MRSLGPRSVRVPTVSGLSRRGMKIYTVEARRMPRYFRVSYHQKWPRTHDIRQTTTGGVLALIALLPSFGLAAFDDLVAVTVGTQHGYEYHDALLLQLSAAWHTWG